MTTLLVLPVLIPLTFSALALLAGGSCRLQQALGLGASAGTLGASALIARAVFRGGIQAIQLGNWPAPFGITFVADRFSVAMQLTGSALGLSCMAYSIFEIGSRRTRLGFYPLLLALLAGANGAFLAGDLFNLYVWFEVLLIASFALLTLGNRREQLKGAVPYVTMSLLSSALFLSGIGTLYGSTGSLNLAELALRLREPEYSGQLPSLSALFLLAFGIKAAVFPLFFWLPESYHTPPVTVSAVFAGLLTKVGVYALVRVFTLFFLYEQSSMKAVLQGIAVFTMFTGVLGAAAQNEFRRILSFHIISQIGYMVMGLSFFTPLALAGVLLFIVHNIIVKSALFLISGIAYRLRGTFELKRLGGLYRSNPLLSALFLVSAFSLAGLPPLSGFWGKLVLAKAGMEISQYTAVAASLAVGLLTLFSMTKIWLQAFWKPAPESAAAIGSENLPLQPWGLLLPTAGLALLAVVIGLFPEPFFAFAYQAGAELIDPTSYIQAVLRQTAALGRATHP